MSGPLAQSAERGADNAKVVSSTLTRTIPSSFFFFLISCLHAKTEACVFVTLLLLDMMIDTGLN